MRILRHFCSIVLLPALASIGLSCGSMSDPSNSHALISSNRLLQSITINSVVNGATIQFTATGTFSAPPYTVSPLAVSWSYAPPPPNYNLTAQPFVFSCADPQSPGPIVAMAPSNPGAPTTGSTTATTMVVTSGPIGCQQ
jgi:hypothetical protein